jgi:hypothetical protein
MIQNFIIQCIENMINPFYSISTISSGINIYSFALHPEHHQPSGTCNLSRIVW